MPKVLDASGLILGRLCTAVARRLLAGEEVVIVNAEKALVTGNRRWIFEHYEKRRKYGSTMHGPYYPRTPDRLLRRSVRGMLDHRRPAGKAAYKRLRVYSGTPKEYQAAAKETVEHARWTGKARTVSLGELAGHLGAAAEKGAA